MDLQKMTTQELLTLLASLIDKNKRTSDKTIIKSNQRQMVLINAELMKRGE